jgi:hypothetical protein
MAYNNTGLVVIMHEYSERFTVKEIQWAHRQYVDSFLSANSFEEYIRREKIRRMERIPTPLFDPSEYLFARFDMHPQDMDFELVFMENASQLEEYYDMLEITTSQLIERSIPGRSMKMLVKEKNTGEIVGFLRLGSPVINMKPRNTLLGVRDYTAEPGLSKFNDSSFMGQNIVPVQPFGFNYIGGKLLALLCVAHEVREKFNEKYGIELLLFETTSLYGSIKNSSQYDGLKPFIRHGGSTESQFIPPLQDEIYIALRDWFEEHIEDHLLDPSMPSSRKMKIQRKMESIIINFYKDHDMSESADQFKDELQQIKTSMTTQKRYYYSTFGFENAVPYMLGRADALARGQNYDKFYMDNIIEWWKKKATNRYERLIEDGRLRRRLEVWTDKETQDTVDIIR